MTGQDKVVDVTAQSPVPQGSRGLESVTDLLQRARDGDPRALEEILHRYRGVVISKVRSFGLQDADALDAIQMTWLRLAENCHGIQLSEQLAGWLANTASRECLRILRQRAQHTSAPPHATVERVADPPVGPEQHALDTETAQRLWSLIATLSPRHQILLRELFFDNPRPYAEIARNIGIPAGSIGPTRARALRQLRRKLDERGLGSEAAVADAVEEEAEATEGDRTGSHCLDNLLDKAEQALREKLEPKVTDLRIGSTQGTGDAQLDDLLHRADAALRAALRDHGTTVSGFLSTKENDPRSGRRFTPPAGS
jgi:RNA polymerase sigma factor (sigma-70 family)